MDAKRREKQKNWDLALHFVSPPPAHVPASRDFLAGRRFKSITTITVVA
jgi:hypothetical protein